MLDTRMNVTSALPELPAEVWEEIKSLLSGADLARLSMMNKAWYQSLNVDIARKSLFDFSITQIVPIAKGALFLDSLGKVWKCENQLYITEYEEHDKQDREKYNRKLPKVFPVLIEELPRIKHISTDAVGQNIFLLDEEGKVWVCGSNRFDQLGLGSDLSDKNITSFTQIQNLPAIKQIKTTVFTTFFLDVAGDVWSCGRDSGYKIPIEEGGYFFCKATPGKIAGLSGITHLAPGWFFIDKMKEVWMCKPSEGCAVASKPTSMAPTKLSGLFNITQIPKASASFFLDERGGVWVCGNNRDGSLGLGGIQEINTPILVPELPPIKQIVPAYGATFFIDVEDKVWACGRNDKNCLGLGEIKKANVPMLVPGLPRIKKIISYDSRTFFIDDEGSVWICGLSIPKEWGFAEFSEQMPARLNEPTRLPLSNIKNVEERDGYTVFIDKFGNMKTFSYYAYSANSPLSVIAPFNFTVGHLLNIVQSCHLSSVISASGRTCL